MKRWLCDHAHIIAAVIVILIILGIRIGIASSEFPGWVKFALLK